MPARGDIKTEETIEILGARNADTENMPLTRRRLVECASPGDTTLTMKIQSTAAINALLENIAMKKELLVRLADLGLQSNQLASEGCKKCMAR